VQIDCIHSNNVAIHDVYMHYILSCNFYQLNDIDAFRQLQYGLLLISVTVFCALEEVACGAINYDIANWLISSSLWCHSFDGIP